MGSVMAGGPRAPSRTDGFGRFGVLIHPISLNGVFSTLHPNSKSAHILKAALQRRRISKALWLFKGNSVFDALRRLSIIQATAFSVVRGSDALFPINDFGESCFYAGIVSKTAR